MKIRSILIAGLMAVPLLSLAFLAPQGTRGSVAPFAPRKEAAHSALVPLNTPSEELPDLLIRQIMPLKGQEIRVAVSNLGKATSESCLIRAEVWRGGESFKRDGTVKGLHPGQYNIVTIDTSPHDVSEQGLIIKLRVDPTNEVKESNENNNSKCKGCIAIPKKK